MAPARQPRPFQCYNLTQGPYRAAATGLGLGFRLLTFPLTQYSRWLASPGLAGLFMLKLPEASVSHLGSCVALPQPSETLYPLEPKIIPLLSDMVGFPFSSFA